MIDKYLERGEMFILDGNGVKAECVVTKEKEGIYELKSIAVKPDCQRKGYGKDLIEFLFSYYTDCKAMLVGTVIALLHLIFIRSAALQSHIE